MKNTLIKMKNKLEGIKSIIDEIKEWICKLEERVLKITAAEHIKAKKRMKRKEDSLRDLWDNIKSTNSHLIRVTEGEEIEKKPDKIFEEKNRSDCAILSGIFSKEVSNLCC